MRALARAVERALGAVVAALLAALVVLAAGETLAWIVAGATHAAIGEVSGVLLAWLGLLAAAWGVAGRLHLAVELVARRLPPPWARATGRFAAAAVATFGALLAVHGARLAATVVNTLPATGLPAAVGYHPAVVGGVLIAFFGLVEAVVGEAPGTTRGGAETARAEGDGLG